MTTLGLNFVVVFMLPVNIFSIMLGQFPVILGSTITKQILKCLAQEQNTVTLPAVSLELVNFRSPINRATVLPTMLNFVS